MAVTRESVLHVAKLARLELSEQEIGVLEKDLNQILEYVELLGELDTSGVPETAHLAVPAAPLRDDRAARGLPTEVALGEAPRHADASFAVPAFMDET